MAVIEFIGGVLADKVLGKVCSLFKTNVIERWSRKRADEFVRTFCDAVSKGRDTEEALQLLNEIMADEAKSAALFDAYRRVALSSSPTIGPRIIALVTAKIVSQNRDASPDEERILSVSELLNDAEFGEAKDWFERYVCKLPQPGTHFQDLGHEEDVASTDLWDGWGAWAAKLGQFGFIQQSIRIIAKEYNVREFTEIGKPQLATDMYYDHAYAELVALIDLATQTCNGTEPSDAPKSPLNRDIKS
jgi:hypothetical protein